MNTTWPSVRYLCSAVFMGSVQESQAYLGSWERPRGQNGKEPICKDQWGTIQKCGTHVGSLHLTPVAVGGGHYRVSEQGQGTGPELTSCNHADCFAQPLCPARGSV